MFIGSLSSGSRDFVNVIFIFKRVANIIFLFSGDHYRSVRKLTEILIEFKRSVPVSFYPIILNKRIHYVDIVFFLLFFHTSE